MHDNQKTFLKRVILLWFYGKFISILGTKCFYYYSCISIPINVTPQTWEPLFFNEHNHGY